LPLWVPMIAIALALYEFNTKECQKVPH
jgi:hypothetical protein